MEDVNQRGRVAILVGQPQLGVLAALGEVAEPVLALLLLHQSKFTGGEPVRPVEFDGLTVGEDNRLTGVELGGTVGVAL